MTSPAQISAAINKVLNENKRKTLDVKLHFVPINIEVAKATLMGALRESTVEIGPPQPVSPELEAKIQEIVNGMADYVRKRHKSSLDLRKLPEGLFSNNQKTLKALLPAVVYDDKEIVGALYSGYTSAYNGLFRDYLNKEVAQYLNKLRYANNLSARREAAAPGKTPREYRIGFDVGHLVSDKADYTVSPAYLKLKDTLASIDGLISGSSPEAITIPKEYLTKYNSELTELRRSVSAELDRLKGGSVYGSIVKASLEKVANLEAFLASSSAVVVIAQDRLENQYFYGSKLEGKVVGAVYKLLSTVNYSRNVEEEIEYGIGRALQGKPLGPKKVTKKQLPKQTIAPNPVNIKLSFPTKTKAKAASKPTKAAGPLRNLAGQFTGLATLQRILDLRLAQQIKDNMGNGNRKDILNLRSGRFAESAKVERLSQSREGMITAFYRYMKYQYQTFEPGYKQGSPASRNPKLLISRSIRQLLAEQVNNKLRAVSI